MNRNRIIAVLFFFAILGFISELSASVSEAKSQAEKTGIITTSSERIEIDDVLSLEYEKGGFQAGDPIVISVNQKHRSISVPDDAIIKYIGVKSSDLIAITLPARVKSLTFREILFSNRAGFLKIVGDSTNCLQLLAIEKVQSTYSGDPASIELANIKLERLELSDKQLSPSGQPQSTFNFTCGENTEILGANIRDVSLANIKLRFMVGEAYLFINNADIFQMQVEGGVNCTLPNYVPNIIMNVEAKMKATSTQRATLELSKLHIKDGEIQLTSSSHSAGGYSLKLHHNLIGDVGRTVRFELSGIRGELDATNIFLNEALEIETRGYETIVIQDVRDKDRRARSSLQVCADSIRSLSIVELQTKQLKIGGIIAEDANIEIRNWDVDESMLLNRDFLVRILTDETISPYQKSSFSRLAQILGQYSDNGRSINLDALYYRKKTDLRQISPILTIAVDYLTGFGVELRKPALFFAILLMITAIAHILSVPGPGIMNRIVLGIHLMRNRTLSSEQPIPKESAMRILLPVRAAFKLIVFVQVTMLSIYLSQTTLQ